MFVTPEGKEIFVVDGHTHFWDGSPENQRNIHGKQFIECFYGYHMALSPPEQRWEKSKFEKYSADDLYRDLFIDGPDDMAIVQSTYLKDFYKDGFNTIERNVEVAQQYPDRFIVNGAFDPRDGEKALEYIHFMKETYDIKGVKLYTAEWNGEFQGLAAQRSSRLQMLRAVRQARHQEHARPQGADHHPAQQGRVRRARRRLCGHRFPEPQLDRRALRPAAPRRFLLDRGPGDQRLWRPRGGAAVHPLAARAISPR